MEKMLSEAEKTDPMEYEKRKVEEYNASRGNLNEEDGYDCKLCMNRGYTGTVELINGCIYTRYPECRCMGIRRSIHRMKQSGLENSIREYTFERFDAKEPWQQAMLETAKRYLAEGAKEGRWLYMGGQPGCGKTHLCTAVARSLLYEKPLLYVIWPQISKKLKALVNEAEDYEREISRLQRIEVLYIDDLFKPVKDDYGKIVPPTPADLRVAFELLNYRYVNKLPTILSSEWKIAELADMDEATASRIAERSRGYCKSIERDRQRNYRLNGETVI